MLKTIVLLLLIVSVQVHAQITVTNQSLTQPNVAQLYTGLPNKIVVTGNTSAYYNLVSSTGFKITKDSANQFLVVANYNQQHDTLKVIANGKVVYQKTFEIKRLNDIAVRVGNIKTGRASVAEILLQPFLRLSFIDALYKMPLHVTSFTFYTNDATLPEINCSGPYFNADIISCIKTLKSGSVIYFDNIKVIGPDSPSRTMASIKLTIR